MHYAHILKSLKAEIYYTGSTSDLKRRVFEHNAGVSFATKPYIPWKLVFYAAFEDEYLSKNFEKYLKAGSGKAFARKRLVKVST
jgi:predicted GIY-YIG superfamily endonuclease